MGTMFNKLLDTDKQQKVSASLATLPAGQHLRK
jgi:hypothetical protein